MTYDVGIIGAGLAGLALGIQLSGEGRKVVIFEKSAFPFHKLCGEYLSRESLPFLRRLGLDYEGIGPAEISRILITNASGAQLESPLDLGGIGLSRWRMDDELARLAREQGTTILENTLVRDSEHVNGTHVVHTKNGDYSCDLLISAFGKKSNLSQKNKLSKNKKNQYLGIKYHVKLADYPADLISMHNFKDGYCGVCRLEEDWVSVCYLSHTNNLRSSGNSIQQMQEQILYKNKAIKRLFEQAEFLYEKPIAVSNIEFKKKRLIHDNVIYVGDAAGLITPLCGNGMSMSLHGSAILAPLISQYLRKHISESELFNAYADSWNKKFKRRMAAGRSIQQVFRHERTADLGLKLLNCFPAVNQRLLSLTHGAAF